MALCNELVAKLYALLKVWDVATYLRILAATHFPNNLVVVLWAPLYLQIIFLACLRHRRQDETERV